MLKRLTYDLVAASYFNQNITWILYILINIETVIRKTNLNFLKKINA